MKKKQYITIYLEEDFFNESYKVGLISNDIEQHKKYKKEMLTCDNIVDVKIFDVKEVNVLKEKYK